MNVPLIIRGLAVAALLTVISGPASAQLGIGPVGDTIGRVGGALGEVAGGALDPLDRAVRDVATLARERVDRLARFVGTNARAVERDDRGEPAVRGEVLLLDPDPTALRTASEAGFALLEEGAVDGLAVRYARLSTPPGMALASAVKRLRKALPGRDISADQLHFPAGKASQSATKATPRSTVLPRGGTVGVIDGGIAGSARLVAQKGFATGAPRTSDHASAIASLLTGAGTARIVGADVYGSDPAGGSALAIARALGWMKGQGVPVVSISLVGPANPLLARAIAAARAGGMVVVAAVGNDGAAAPPAYPASYPGVVAVTGVDGAGRVLLEAGRASHLDYAAPGADLSALVPGKGRVALRGTSYAAPLAASRIAARRANGAGGANQALAAVDAEALNRARRTGRGVVCNICRSGL